MGMGLKRGESRIIRRSDRAAVALLRTHVVSLREALPPFPQPDDAVGRDLDLLQWVVRILHLVARAPREIPGNNGR